MSMLDSEPVFKTRMLALGVSNESLEKFIQKGINTLARLAYSSAAQPGTGDDSPFVQMVLDVLEKQNIQAVGMGEMSSLRRVWFEAHTVAVSEIRARVERTEGAEPLKMPVAERENRLREQQGRLSGVFITPSLEPSHQLIDYVNQMRTDEVLRYLDPAKCTSREQEIKGVKREAYLKQNTDGTLKVVKADEEMIVDVSTEFKARLSLQRRSLALDLAHLCPYDVSEHYHNFLFDLLLHDVPDSHCRISLAQILSADKMVFQRMAEKCRGGISQRVDGTYPFVQALQDARMDPVVAACLAPLPKAAGGAKWDKGSPEKQAKGKGRGKNVKSTIEKKEGSKLPDYLRGLKRNTKQGKPICFGANMECGCKFAKPGAACKKGLHVCMKCGKAGHGAWNCNSSSPSPVPAEGAA